MRQQQANSIGHNILIINSDVSVISSFLSGKTISVLFNIIYAIAIFIIIVKSNISLGLLVVLFSYISYKCFMYYGAELKKQYRTQKKQHDIYTGFITQILNSITEIKLLGILKSIVRKHNDNNHNLMASKKSLQYKSISSQTLLSVISQIESLFVMVIGVILVAKESLSVEMFIALLHYTQKFTSSVTNISTINSDYQQYKVAFERYTTIMNGMEREDTGLACGIIAGNIEIKNLTFSYDSNSENSIFKSIDLSIKSNQINTLIGKSGCGKTTIVNILCGLYPKSSRTITIDGIDIDKFNKQYLLSCVAIVTQQPKKYTNVVKKHAFMNL